MSQDPLQLHFREIGKRNGRRMGRLFRAFCLAWMGLATLAMCLLPLFADLAYRYGPAWMLDGVRPHATLSSGFVFTVLTTVLTVWFAGIALLVSSEHAAD